MVNFLNGNKQQESKIQAPSEDQISIAQDELNRIQQQVQQQSEIVTKQQQHLQELTEALKLAQGNLSQLQIEKANAELERQQSSFVKELRALADRINQQSWELGLNLQEFNAKISTTPEGIRLSGGKRVTFEAPDLQVVRRYRNISVELLPLIWHQVGDNRFTVGFRYPANPGERDRLSLLRESEGKS